MQIAPTHKGPAAFWVTNGCTSMSKPITTWSTPMGVDNHCVFFSQKHMFEDKMIKEISQFDYYFFLCGISANGEKKNKNKAIRKYLIFFQTERTQTDAVLRCVGYAFVPLILPGI